MNLDRMKQLIAEINIHDHNYYMLDKPTISDKAYDAKYNELLMLEAQTGIVLSNSPTQRVPGAVNEKLPAVKHSTVMLSSAKTKSVDEVVVFAGDNEVLGMYKLDGATMVVKYNNGKLIQAISRGNGIEGEDVTKNAAHFMNLPLSIPFQGYFETRGECMITWEDFNRINAALPEEDRFAHPRGLASSSMRLLDSGRVKDRCLNFLAFSVINDLKEALGYTKKQEQLQKLQEFGFEVVPNVLLQTGDDIKKYIESVVPENYKFPIDGLMFEFNDIAYGDAQTCTSHHSNRNLAFKFADNTVETKFLGVELKTGRTGVVSITALFEPVEIDGSMVGRASVHNVDIFESYEFGVGDTCTIYKANMIIPQTDDNLTRSNTYQLPMACPTCGNALKIVCPAETRVLYCDNEECSARLLQKFVHFCQKDAMNIDGLSEATLAAFIENGWISKFADLYHLKDDDFIKASIMDTAGFGAKSCDKLLKAIEASRNTTLARFIVAMGIPNIGRSASKAISKACNGNVDEFFKLCADKGRIEQLEDFGPKMCCSLYNWFSNTPVICEGLVDILSFESELPQVIATDSLFSGKTICITGSFAMGSREEIQKRIEALGGKFTGSVSKKTDILLAGDKCGSKLEKANSCGVRVMNEQELIQALG